MNADQPIRILFVEDIPADVELAERALKKEGLVFVGQRVATAADLAAALADFRPDLIISDYSMPGFNGMQALRLSLERDPLLPFIMFTGSLNEETAVACMKAGATDYVLKDRIARLPFAVQEALAQKQARHSRELAEQALRDSEELYRQTLASISDAVFLTDEQARFIMVCPNVDATFGWTADEAVALGNLRALIGDGPLIPDDFADELLNIEWTVADKFGRTHDLLVHIRRVHIKQATRLYVCRDITERKQAEAALLESNTKFQALFEASPDAIVLIDPQDNWRIVDCNVAACQMNGYTRDELVGHSIDLLNVTPGTPAERADYLARIRQHGMLRQEAFHRRKDGSVFSIDISTCLIPLNGHEMLLGIDRDVTDRKQAEEALRDSERREREHALELQTIMDVVPATILIAHDQMCQTVTGNRAAYADRGLLAGDNLSANIRDTPYAPTFTLRQAGLELPPHEWPLQVTAATGVEIRELEFEQVFEDGRVVYTLGNVVPLFDDLGRPRGAVGAFIDITERKWAEDALRESEERFRVIFEHANDAIHIDNADDEILNVNSRLCELMGYSREELLRMHVSDLQAPEVRQSGRVIVTELTRHGDALFEGLNMHRSGRRIPVEISVARIARPEGDLYVSVVRDITERKQRERELEAIATTAMALRAASDRGEMLPVIVHQVASLLKTDAAVLYAIDPATGDALVALGHGSGTDWTGARLPSGSGIVGQVITARRPYLTNDVAHEPLISQPDLVRDLAAIACVPLIAQDQIIGAIWVGRKTAISADEVRLLVAIGDIAANALQRAQVLGTLEQRVADRTRELAVANERLQELDRLKSKFVSDVSHELRTPVTSLSLYVDLLEHGKLEKRDTYIAQLKAQMARLRTMIEEILDLARLERAQAEGSLTPIDLNSIVEHVIAQQEVAAEAAGLRLIGETSDRALIVMARPDQLTRAVTNLVANAIKYTSAGSIRVQVTTEGSRACVRVSDTGMGIAPEDVPHVFDRFYRGQQVAQSNIPGTGLGLAIVKEIVEAQGGTVEVQSQLGRGSTFGLWLPIAAE